MSESLGFVTKRQFAHFPRLACCLCRRCKTRNFSDHTQRKSVTLPKLTFRTQVGLDTHFINRRLTDELHNYHSAITFHLAISSSSLPWVMQGLIWQAVMGPHGCCPRDTARGLLLRQELNCLIAGLGESTVGLNRRKTLKGRSDKNNRWTQSALSEFSSLRRIPVSTRWVLTPQELTDVEHAFGRAWRSQVSAFKGHAASPGRWRTWATNVQTLSRLKFPWPYKYFNKKLAMFF